MAKPPVKSGVTEAFNPASQFASELLGTLIELGVQHVALAPGSRSQALALAAASAAQAGKLSLHVFIDERSAAFFALGVGRESGVPALVLTTSGSAVGNLLPATMEAWHAGVPLLLVTADRPAALRSRRANQTTRQLDALAGFVAWARDVAPPAGSALEVAAAARTLAVAAFAGAGAGPAHLNLQFAEPLSGAIVSLSLAERAKLPARRAPAPALDVEVLDLQRGPRTLVVAGAGAGEAAEQFARELDAPLIAEVVSGAHFGPQLVVPYRALLNLPEFAEGIERVVVFGTPTLSRELPALFTRGELEVIVVDSPGGDRFAPTGRDVVSAGAVRVAAAPLREQAERELADWSRAWLLAGRKLLTEAEAQLQPAAAPLENGVGRDGHVSDFAAQREFVQTELAALRAPLTRGRLVSAVWRASWPHDRLVFAASRLVREADRVLAGKKVRVHANRGLAGIDGTIAVARGIAAANPGGVTRVILGDLATLHDAGSLAVAAGESAAGVQLIVGNDSGGSIFDQLEVAGSAPREAFDRVLFTPHTADLSALAAAYGWEYRRALTVGELDQVLTEAFAGPVLVEVPLER